ncbi:jupiter microtubule associated homolog 2 [Aethina tumida]|uniref:jupiter microtubule associated homolog 2 n=1 Tax=Aethina tumida TaxID=116153 RepID=UPI00096AEF82|nr:jupiter microtubule associated homolog 2 [Aethina tumida]
MTSTSYNVGLADSKNSSRVLKPPGGGHSDIFGIRSDPQELMTPSKKNQPTSQISECFTHMDPPKNNEKTENEAGTVDENVAPEEKIKKIDEVEAPKARTRVPPGGYSTALW